MEYSYPLLNKVFDYFSDQNKDLKDIYLVCCQHLLGPQLKMFELFIDFGFDPKKIFVLGKAYSTNIDVFKNIQQTGINVFQPNFTGISFDEEHRNNCEMIIKLIPENTHVVVLDDGAELIKTFSNANRSVLFGVEQTSSGFRKLENDNLSFPVINVARSATKLNQESPFIARQGFERINNYFLSKNIRNPKILVVGLGPIGEAILEIFKQGNFIVEGFDIKHGHSDLIKVIKEKGINVVIGATGVNILGEKDIESLVSDKVIYLISISSSDREFSIAQFRKNKEIHTDVVYKNICILNNGFPITFKGNRNENTPIEMEKTICLLSGTVLEGVVNSSFDGSGLINVSEGLENLINS